MNNSAIFKVRYKANKKEQELNTRAISGSRRAWS